MTWFVMPVMSVSWKASVPNRALCNIDRVDILEEWIQRAIEAPVREVIQADRRIRRWAQIPECDGRFLRVVLLADGETVHNAFFDRGFSPGIPTFSYQQVAA